MPPGIDVLTAAPMTIDVGGRSLRIAPLDLDDLGELQAWIHSQVLLRATTTAQGLVSGMPKDVQVALLNHAYDQAMTIRESYALGGAGADSILGTSDGVREVLRLAIRKHHPELGREDVAKLLGLLEPASLDRIMSHAFGDESGPATAAAAAAAAGNPSDPKGPQAEAISIGRPSTGDSASSLTDSPPMRSVG